MNRFVAFLLAVVVALAIVAAPAFAQTSANGYQPPSSNVQAEIQSDSPSKTPSASSDNGGPAAANATKAASGSQLPFTGLDVGLLLGAGLALLLVGGALSRLTRSASRTE